jgi:hypothetical protein
MANASINGIIGEKNFFYTGIFFFMIPKAEEEDVAING